MGLLGAEFGDGDFSEVDDQEALDDVPIFDVTLALGDPLKKILLLSGLATL